MPPINESSKLTPADYARFAQLSDAEIATSCSVDVFHATGPGGQCVNTSDSAVRMTHLPTGIVVVSRESRSQLQNREQCVAKLRAEFARRAFVPKKRTATKPTHGSQKRRLEDKHRRSAIKSLRGKPSGEE